MRQAIASIAAAIALAVSGTALSQTNPECTAQIESFLERTAENGAPMLDLDGKEFDKFDLALQSLGGPEAPAEIDRVILLDPRELDSAPANGIITAALFGSDDCYIGDARFPIPVLLRVLDIKDRFGA